jgi:AraC-like DNA-binding protein
MTKPFDTSELIVRVNGLIKNRKMVREKIQLELSQNISGVKNTSEFIQQFRNEILKQLSSPNLNVDSLANKFAISRSSLNRKCKNELDKSPLQYITEMRMQHALTLLKAKKHSVSEIAYGVGFESLAYFSKTFKKFYNYTPSSVQ